MAIRSTRNHSLVLNSDLDKTATTSEFNATTSIALNIGASTVLNATASAANISTDCKITGMLLDGNGFALDLPGSYHLSGAGAGEKRTLTLHPNLVATDAAGNSVRAMDAADDSATFTESNQSGSLRTAASSQDGFSYFSGIPIGWRGYALQVNYVHRTSGAAQQGRVQVITRPTVRVGSAPFGTVVNFPLADGANAVINMASKIVHGSGKYSIIHHEFGSNTQFMYMGGTLYLERVP